MRFLQARFLRKKGACCSIFSKTQKFKFCLQNNENLFFSSGGSFNDPELEFLYGNDSAGIAHDSPCQSVRVHFVQLLKCEKLNKTEISEQLEKHGESKWFSSSDNQLARPCKRRFSQCCRFSSSVRRF